MQNRLIGGALTAAIAFSLAGRVHADSLESRPGWSWAIAPVRLADYDWPKKTVEVDMGFLKITVPPPKGPGLGALVGARTKLHPEIAYDIAWTQRSDETEFTIVLFDDEGKRCDSESSRGWGDKRSYTQQYTYTSKEVRLDHVTHIGVEMLTPDGRREVANTAYKQAQAAGVEVLPLPVVGEPFAFSLATRSGIAASSDNLHGKVVLIDCWATWCTPCMAKMPKLKALYDEHRGDGFEIVGINFDESFADMDAAVQKNGLTWPMVHVQDDDTVRDYWYRAASIRMLPRLLVIGRDGKLFADCTPLDLHTAIESALKAEQ